MYHVSFNVPDEGRRYGYRGDYRCVAAESKKDAIRRVRRAIPDAEQVCATREGAANKLGPLLRLHEVRPI